MVENKKFKYNIFRQNFINNMITVTGTTQSGKSLVGPIICSLKELKIIELTLLLEQVPMLYGLEKIDQDVAIFLLRYGMELMQYDNMIGRNTNFRYSDFSSIWLTKDPSQFYKRLTMEEGESVFKRIKKRTLCLFSIFTMVLCMQNYYLNLSLIRRCFM